METGGNIPPTVVKATNRGENIQAMKAIIVGLNHNIQLAEIWKLGIDQGQIEENQKKRFRQMLETIIKECEIQFIGEEMDVAAVWEAQKHFMENLAVAVRRPPMQLPDRAETIACQVANTLECNYAEIDIQLAQRELRGIPRNYTDEESPYSEEQKRKWNEEREQYMVEHSFKNVGDAQNVLILCGSNHAENLSELFRQAGHEVETRYVRNESWYIENWS